jgi:hypothetical protein
MPTGTPLAWTLPARLLVIRPPLAVFVSVALVIATYTAPTGDNPDDFTRDT